MFNLCQSCVQKLDSNCFEPLTDVSYNVVVVKEIGVIQLLELITKDLIQLNIEATDREDAIRKAAQPLVDANKITDSYIDGIIKSMKESGPYFVIIPHVAMPHARPEEGALENAIGITTLKTPIEFMNASNDPVKYVLTLSATGNDEHLETLASLAELVEEDSFFELLDKATSAQEVIDYLKER